jgi:hypothetical protein
LKAKKEKGGRKDRPLVSNMFRVYCVPAAHEALVYAGSGHTVGTFPYLPQGIASDHPVTGQRLELGGTRVGDETARRAGWPRVLALLDSLGR